VIHCNCDAKFFCCDPRPCSCIFSTVSTSPFESSAQTPLIFASFISAIFDCVFNIFLLVFSIHLQGKAFMARSIKLCLVDNQLSSGVTVAGSESCRFEAKIANVESPQIAISIYLSEDRAISYHVVYIPSRYGERDIHSCHVLINVLSLHYRRSITHIPDNVSEPSNIVENLQ
jgi:hypothetical protein